MLSWNFQIPHRLDAWIYYAGCRLWEFDLFGGHTRGRRRLPRLNRSWHLGSFPVRFGFCYWSHHLGPAVGTAWPPTTFDFEHAWLHAFLIRHCDWEGLSDGDVDQIFRWALWCLPLGSRCGGLLRYVQQPATWAGHYSFLDDGVLRTVVGSGTSPANEVVSRSWDVIANPYRV